MALYHINTKNIKAAAQTLNAGDTVYLSGIVYTSRDAAHKRIFELINKGAALPYDIMGLYSILQVLLRLRRDWQ